jgi:hypothetical protein
MFDKYRSEGFFSYSGYSQTTCKRYENMSIISDKNDVLPGRNLSMKVMMTIMKKF